jgi:hypothetical protein
MNSYSIYQLVDPRDNTPFYVGYSQTPETRYLQHMRGGIVNKRLSFMLANLTQEGLQPIIEVLETLEGDEQKAKEREVYWIQKYREMGLPLVNVGNTSKGRDKVTYYLEPGQLDKLEDMRIAYKKATGKRLNEQDFMRLIIERLELNNLL